MAILANHGREEDWEKEKEALFAYRLHLLGEKHFSGYTTGVFVLLWQM